MAVLEIVTHPDAILRKKADAVTEITPEILKLLDDMVDTMYVDGIGLAAPQINVSKRLIVVDVEPREDGERGTNPIKMINPEIIAKGEELTALNEGCLSLPEMRVEVTRPDQVTVRYMDIDGTTKEMTATGLLSKALQHEIDHLDGILIFDYLSKMKRDIVLRKYNKIMRQS